MRCLVNDQEKCSFIFTSSDVLKDDKVYKCLFNDHGGHSIVLKTNDKFEIEQTYHSGPKTYHFRIESCTAEGINDQPKDFVVQTSALNKNGTGPS